MLKKFILFAFCLVLLPGVALGQENIPERFSAHDPNSNVRINHEALTEYLEITVLPVGRSYRFLGNTQAEQYKGSRIKLAKSQAPSRYEGSRLLVHAFTPEHEAFFKAYQEGLERLSNRRALAELNQSEQAAFWLNLYNVVVINHVVREYPIQNLKGWRSAKERRKEFWQQKVTTIEGVRLSLSDIENILFTNFESPLLAFGLWQGSIGGPRLFNQAYTGRNVWRSLEGNAIEFVNSNRGLRPPSGAKMVVSDFFEWTIPAFGTSEDHVLSFVKEYADANFVPGVDHVQSISFKIYDWQIADLIGGTRHSGQDNQLGGVLGGGSGGMKARGGGTNRPQAGSSTPGSTETTFGGTNIAGNLNSLLRVTPTGAIEGLPDHALSILNGIRINTERPMLIITVEECGPEEICVIEDLDLEDFEGFQDFGKILF